MNKGITLSKAKIVSYLDQEQKNKKFLPPVGHYKNVEKSYEKISMGPITQKSRRHWINKFMWFAKLLF